MGAVPLKPLGTILGIYEKFQGDEGRGGLIEAPLMPRETPISRTAVLRCRNFADG